MDEPRRPCGVDEALHRRRDVVRAGNVELPRRLHEVDLRVDVPKNATGHVLHSDVRTGPGVPRLVPGT